MTWREIFDILDLEWCQGCEADKHDGVVVGRTIHWSTRRVTRPGIYKILRKIAWAQEHLDQFPTWRQIYLLNADVLLMCRELGIRLPRTVFDLDRARLRFALGEYTLADRRRMIPSEQTDFRAALRWAARS